LLCVSLARCLSSCGEPQLDPPDSLTRRASFDVTCTPDADLDAVARVSRFRLTPSDGRLTVTTGVAIYRGELTDYYLGRIRSGQVPSSLAERLVPSVAWQEAGALIVSPTLPLEPGQGYTLVARSGNQVRLTVRPDDPRPLAARVWPPPGSDAGGPTAVYCGDEVVLGGTAKTELAPDAIAGVIEAGAAPGVAEQRCVRLIATEAVTVGSWLLPPVLVGGILIDPAPVYITRQDHPGTLTCPSHLVHIGPGCADVADDRLTVRAPDVPAFWAIGGSGVDFAQAIEPSGSAVVTGLAPSASNPLRFRAITLGGYVWDDWFTARTSPPAPHVVVNEVMSDPVGPEPQQEWVELFNDGLSEAAMDGWTLEDVGGSAALGAVVLAPGSYALLTRLDYDAESPVDIRPEAGTTIVRLSELGKNGLSNSGEPLVLRDAQGRVVSRFAALPKPKQGVSVARCRPWLTDEDPKSFAYHTADGASPGGPNQVD
jgi:hypothetical protein